MTNDKTLNSSQYVLAPLLTRPVEMSTSLVFACLSGRLELEDLFLLKKKDKRQTRTSHRIFTENLNGQTPFLGFPTHSGVPSGHFQRIRNGPRNGPRNIPNPNRGKFRSGRLGSQADSAKCGFRPLAENLGSWRSHNSRRPERPERP